MKINPSTPQPYLFILLLALICFPRFSHLDSLTIRPFDEPRHAVDAAEMAVSEDLLVTTYGFNPEMSNTNLQLMYWIQYPFLKLVGLIELGIRLAPALSGLFLAILLFGFARDHLDEYKAEIVTALAFLTTKDIYEFLGIRTNDFDIMRTLFISLYVLDLSFHAEFPGLARREMYLPRVARYRMKSNIILLAATLGFAHLAFSQGKTVVEISKDQFYINGRPTYEGRYWQDYKIEGLLLNSRMVQGIFDDLDPETAQSFAYPDTKKWDAKRNNDEFVAAMPHWKSYGLNSFTLNMQGGSPNGYKPKPCLNPGFNPDGSLIPEYMSRLDKILTQADELEMVVILGLFYFRQDQNLLDENAIVQATKNTLDWLFNKGHRNVLIEICNETNDGGKYDHDILLPSRIHELIDLVKTKEHMGYRFLVGTSFGGCKVPSSNVVVASDFLLIHGNGAKEPSQIQKLIDDTKQVDGYRSMPIINNEDDHYNFDRDVNNFTTSLKNYVSWGYFDFRFPGETDFLEGYQSVPVDWGINSERKQAFFRYLKEITGVE